MIRGRAAAAAFGMTLALLGGCLEPRERLDAPRVQLQLEGESVAPGADLRGRLSGADLSGIIYASVSLVVNDDTLTRRSDRLDFVDADTVDFAFQLQVVSTAPRGARIVVTGTIIDNQLFTVSVQDTAYVR